MSSGYEEILGIDNEQNLWVYDYNLMKQEEGTDDCLETRNFERFNKICWFNKNNLKVLDVKSNEKFAIVLTEDSQGLKQFYGIGQKIIDRYYYGCQTIDRFGGGSKAVYGNSIYLIADVDANKVIDYAVTRTSVAYLFEGQNKKSVSIVPDKPEATGLIHFYKKQDGNWAFVTAEEYIDKKDEIPDLCFACRHPIRNFSEK